MSRRHWKTVKITNFTIFSMLNVSRVKTDWKLFLTWWQIGRCRDRRNFTVVKETIYFYVQKRPQGGLLFCCFSGIFLLTGKLEGRCLNCHALIDSFLIIFLALQHLRLRNVYPFFSFPTVRRVTVNIRTFSRFDAETKSFSIKIKIIF